MTKIYERLYTDNGRRVGRRLVGEFYDELDALALLILINAVDIEKDVECNGDTSYTGRWA